MQDILTEPLFQEEKKSTRSASCGRFVLPALLIGLGSAFLVTQMPWTRSVGVKFISTRTSPLNMAFISSARGTGTLSHYNDYVGPAISQQGMDRAMDRSMSHYGTSRYGRVSPRYHDYRYRDYSYYPGDYRRRGRFGYGDEELTFGSTGEPHVASYRFRPGESEIYPRGRYYGGDYYNRYRGGYNDRYGGGYYDRYHGGSYGRYGYGYTRGTTIDDNNWRTSPYR